jgi:hypothetical protein
MTCHRLALVVCLAAATNCFDPRHRVGAMCGPQGECPPGQTCDPDRRCQIASPGGPSDAQAGTHDASIDLPPDAAPVVCERDADCLTPPDACSFRGACDLSVHKCVFPIMDCSRQNTCEPFGSCQNANPQDVCDSGSKSQTCMDFTCQPSTGMCVASARTETVECNGDTNELGCGDDGEQLSCTSCNYTDICDTEASQSCMIVHEKCQNDVCVRQPMPDIVPHSCTRNQDGHLCGPETCGPGQIGNVSCLQGECVNFCVDIPCPPCGIK